MSIVQFGAVRWTSCNLSNEDSTKVRQLNTRRFSKRFEQPVRVRISQRDTRIIQAEYWNPSLQSLGNQSDTSFSTLTKHRDESMDAFLKRIKRTLKETMANPAQPPKTVEPLSEKQMAWLARILRL